MAGYRDTTRAHKTALDVINRFLSNRGCRLLIDNLHSDVEREDLDFLFGSLGPVRRALVFYDASGRSLGCGEVVYVWVADAWKAWKHFNGVSLEGKPMRITCAGRAPGIEKLKKEEEDVEVILHESPRPRKRTVCWTTQNFYPYVRPVGVPPKVVTKEALDHEIDDYMRKRRRFV